MPRGAFFSRAQRAPNALCALLFIFVAAAILPVALAVGGQQSATLIAVDDGHPGPAMSPDMFGIFFEDINFERTEGSIPSASRIAPLNSASRLPGGTKFCRLVDRGWGRRKASSMFAPKIR
jgi:hypothetical protein